MRCRMLSLLSVPFIALFIATTAGATDVSGPIITTTWTKANSPYYVVAQCTVKVGEVLTIESGVEVKAKADVAIIIEGQLQAIGAPGDTIRFGLDVGQPQWGGLRFYGGDTSTVQYAELTGVYTVSGQLAKPAHPAPVRRTKGDRGLRRPAAARPAYQTTDYAGGLVVAGEGTRLGLAHSRIHDNSAQYGGGISINDGAHVTVVDCDVSHNNAISDGEGGGVYLCYASATFMGCTISDNTSMYLAGGVYIYGATAPVEFHDCSITGNETAGDGGGLYIEYSTVTMTGSVISQNGAAIYGGGVEVPDGDLTLTDCVVSGNASSDDGGGVDIWTLETGSVGTFTKCRFENNTGGDGGAMYIGCPVTLDHCLFADNTSTLSDFPTSVAGALLAYNAPLTITNCTFTGNEAVLSYMPGYGGAIYLLTDSLSTLALAVKNTIMWGNIPDEIADDGGIYPISITYSDVQGDTTWAGAGNINAGPLFADTTNGDYHLTYGSPCIDAGDPTSPLDPDTTRADMGAFFFDQSSMPKLVLPFVRTVPGDSVIVPIRATFADAYAVDLVFVVDTSLIVPVDSALFVHSHAFEGLSTAGVAWNSVGDTIIVSLHTEAGSGESVTLEDGVLAELLFRVKEDARYDTTALVWVTSGQPRTNVDEVAIPVKNGQLIVQPRYGDVSGDRRVTSYDASLILQYVVRLIPEIDHRIADVTGNGYISSFDAALVLRKAVESGYVFPVEGGQFPKPATRTPRTLAWVHDGPGWSLVVNDPTDIEAGELTLVVPTEQPLNVTGSDHLAFAQEGTTLRVALVRGNSDEPVLLRIESDAPFAAPLVVEAQFNEGEIPLAGVIRPAEFALAQNVPNPFNPATTIRFSVPHSGAVSLVVYSVNGQMVRTLVNETKDAGSYAVVWDGRDASGKNVASGVYLYRLTSNQGTLVRRMVLVK